MIKNQELYHNQSPQQIDLEEFLMQLAYNESCVEECKQRLKRNKQKH